MEYSGCFIALALTNCFTPLIRLAEERFFLSRKTCAKIQENVL